MFTYQKTSGRVYLMGRLQEKPELMMDTEGDFIGKIVVSREGVTQAVYRVLIYGEPALRIRQYGFIGLYLWIEGDFKNNGEILAEKIQFLDFSKSGDEGCLAQNCYY